MTPQTLFRRRAVVVVALLGACTVEAFVSPAAHNALHQQASSFQKTTTTPRTSFSGHARRHLVPSQNNKNKSEKKTLVPVAMAAMAADEAEAQQKGTALRDIYPRSPYNAAILIGMFSGAVLALLFRDIVAISALYQFDAVMEADWVPESMKLLARLPSDVFRDYGAAAVEHPVFVKACTSAVAYLVGDLIAQAYVGRRDVAYLDLPRTFRNAFAGFLLHGPILHAWIEFLEGPFQTFFSSEVLKVATIQPGTGAEYSMIAAKIALDQTAFALGFNTIYSFALGALARKPLPEVQQNVANTLLPSMVSSWKFWPVVHMVSYSPLVPVQYKLLWIDLMEIAWVAILSFIANDEKLTSGLEPVANTFEDFDVQPAVEVVLARQVEKGESPSLLCDIDYRHDDLRRR